MGATWNSLLYSKNANHKSCDRATAYVARFVKSGPGKSLMLGWKEHKVSPWSRQEQRIVDRIKRVHLDKALWAQELLCTYSNTPGIKPPLIARCTTPLCGT